MNHDNASQHPFLARLAAGILLADGGMGTQLYAGGVPDGSCFDQQNVIQPDLVSRIHRDYLVAGAQLLETNTFGANANKLAMFGLAGQTHQIARAGARLAREAREMAGVDALIAGSVGPLGTLLEPYGAMTTDQARDIFRQQIEALVEGGVDLLILETFADLREITVAVRAARAVCDLPIVAQMTFTEDQFTPTGQTPEGVARMLDHLGVEVIGCNCSVGPQGTLPIVERMARVTERPLSAQPNAGLPAQVAGRLLYLSSPHYMADYALRLAEAGARLIGGCCGTTPAHIAAMSARLSQAGSVTLAPRTPVITVLDERLAEDARPEPVEQTGFAAALRRGLAISVEMRPPRGPVPAKMLRGARLLLDAGADAIDITDSAMARVRMSNLAAGYLVKEKVGIEPMLHLTTRDRNLMALQSDLLGAHALGIRNILALTGDPTHTGGYAHAKGVYDVDSIGLIRILRRLNAGEDVTGNAIGQPTEFLIGAALNPVAQDLEWELERFHRKMEAGPDFVMTQPVYDPQLFARVLDRIGPLPIPILMGVLPLQSYRHAEFLHNELPGVTLTQEALARMRAAGAEGQAEGMAMAIEILDRCLHLVAGVYIVPSFDRYEPAAELVRSLKARQFAGSRV